MTFAINAAGNQNRQSRTRVQITTAKRGCQFAVAVEQVSNLLDNRYDDSRLPPFSRLSWFLSGIENQPVSARLERLRQKWWL